MYDLITGNKIQLRYLFFPLVSLGCGKKAYDKESNQVIALNSEQAHLLSNAKGLCEAALLKYSFFNDMKPHCENTKWV